MRIVALDTATRATAVAVAEVHDGEVPRRWVARYEVAPETGPPGHAVELLAAVERALADAGDGWEGADAGGGWEGVDRIAVGIGPGTFTGLRIGVASAQALAWTRGLPLVGVSSLHALGLGAGLLQAGPLTAPLLALIDARRGEVFAAGWPAGADLLAPPSSPEPSVFAPEQVQAHAARGSVAVGDGAIRFRAVVEQFGVIVPVDSDPVHQISAVNHCRLAATLEPARRPQDVQPAYLRIPDAEKPSAGR